MSEDHETILLRLLGEIETCIKNEWPLNERMEDAQRAARKVISNTKIVKTLLREWWESSKLGLGSGEFESWLSTFTPRVAVALAISEQPQQVPDGTPGIRDARCPCEHFEPGVPEGATINGLECCGDGHYLCNECINKYVDNEEQQEC